MSPLKNVYELWHKMKHKLKSPSRPKHDYFILFFWYWLPITIYIIDMSPF